MARIKLKPEDFYKEDSKYRIYLEGLIRDGYSMEAIADKLDINRTTIYNWMNKDSTFYAIVRDARDLTDIKIESALMRSCQGFFIETEMIDKQGHKQKVMQYIPPSVEAQKFWLKNKKRDKWHDKVEQAVDTTAIDLLGSILGSLKEKANGDDNDT